MKKKRKWDITKHTNICPMRVPEVNSEKRAENIQRNNGS